MKASKTKLIFVNVILVLVFAALIEGGVSLFLFTWDAFTNRGMAERLHTQYDPELGWVNLPNVHISDMYGAGRQLTTNSRGFRGRSDVADEVQTGKRRVVCVGDSFTLGYGVDDLDTWCHLLGTLDPELETVNMGQGGYGADQAYLWYKRDTKDVDHHLTVLAFITEGFRRMQEKSIAGYGKPILKLENDKLEVDNVPVPESAFFAPWLTQNIDVIRSLRSVEFLNRIRNRLGSTDSQELQMDRDSETRAILRELLVDLEKTSTERGSELILVYLPTPRDYEPNKWRAWADSIEEVASELDIPFINLIEPIRGLDREEMTSLFIQDGVIDFPGAHGHLNEKGNRYAAETIAGVIANRTGPPRKNSAPRETNP